MLSKLKYWLNSTLNSYGQIFYSLNKLLSISILVTTFLTPNLGLTGLFGVILINFIAHIIGVNRHLIEKGLYGFNALLLGLFLGYQYEYNWSFLLLFVVSITLLLIISVWLNGILSKHRLPFLSFPFVITYAIVVLSTGNFSNIFLNADYAFVINHQTKEQLTWIYQFSHILDDISIPNFLRYYFKTVSATFFQTSLLGGILIAIGLLIFSRIAFSLSLIGFASAYLFYQLFGANLADLNHNLVGSNFIFMAIGIGSFYIIPNLYSYIAVFVLTPLLMMLMIFLNKVLGVYQLSSFTLAFSMIVCLFLLFLKNRWFHKYLQLVEIQYYSPEKTIYKLKSSLKRFKNAHLYKVQLPFWGEWTVSQGYDGTITHLGEWGKALDFVIEDNQKKTYQGEGYKREDYYCYNKPVVAPYEGYVYAIHDYVEENDINGVDIKHNWGNTIIINHLNGLYSQLSHLKKDSIKVEEGDFVKKGDLLAMCGNSGRSPEPHIHFQFQLSSELGAKTYAYPISYFVEHNGGDEVLKFSEIPKENSVIRNINSTDLFVKSFNFLPGQKLEVTNEQNQKVEHWEVFTDAFNRTYILENSTKSVAYFENDGKMCYFYDFEGSRKSALYQFYLISYRILLGIEDKVQVKDDVPLNVYNTPIFQWIQDFFAPFYLMKKVDYTSSLKFVNDFNKPQKATIKSKVESKLFGIRLKGVEGEINLEDDKMTQFSFNSNTQKNTYLCTFE